MKRTLLFVLVTLALTSLTRPVHGRIFGAPLPPGEIRFQQAGYSVAENAGMVDLVVERVNGSDGEITAILDTFDGTATAGQDYPATAETLVFADGEITKTVSIPIIDNNTSEPDETFLASLSILGNAGSVGDPGTTTVTILDDDTTPPGVLHFSAAQVVVLEDAGLALMTVQRSGGTRDEVGVSYQTANGTAVAGSDYMPAVGTLTFADGETEQSFSVTLLDDPGDEEAETFTIQLMNVVGVATLGEPDMVTVTILDDETAHFVYLPLMTR